MVEPAMYAPAAMNHPRIDGVKTKALRLIPDERGFLLEILRADDPDLFTKFGQVYVSATYPGVVKAWHYHQRQVDNFACVAGMVKLVLVDTRADSPTKGAVNERSEEHTSELQSPCNLVCRLLLEKKNELPRRTRIAR